MTKTEQNQEYKVTTVEVELSPGEERILEQMKTNMRISTDKAIIHAIKLGLQKYQEQLYADAYIEYLCSKTPN